MKYTLILISFLFLTLLSACGEPPENRAPAIKQQLVCGGTCSGIGVGAFQFSGECTEDGIIANAEKERSARERARQDAINDASLKCIERGGSNCICSGGEMLETEYTSEEYGLIEELEADAEVTGVVCVVTITYQYSGGECTQWDMSDTGTANCSGLVTRSGMSRGGEYGICPQPCNLQLMEEVREASREQARRAVNEECAATAGYVCQAIGGRDFSIGEWCRNDPDVFEGDRPECDYFSHRIIQRAQCVFAP